MEYVNKIKLLRAQRIVGANAAPEDLKREYLKLGGLIKGEEPAQDFTFNTDVEPEAPVVIEPVEPVETVVQKVVRKVRKKK